MKHRHLNHSGFTLAAIDDIISRGVWDDWAELRRAMLSDVGVLAKVKRIAFARANESPRTLRYQFWRRYAQRVESPS